MAEQLGLGPKLRTRFADLSGGQQQRLAIALALVGRPRVALLDELSTGLDPRSRRDVWRVVEGARDAGTTIILVTHLMEEARHLADRVALVDRGRITALDTPDGVIALTRAPTVMSFTPSRRLDPAALEALERVDGVATTRSRDDGRIELSLSDDAVVRVLSWLSGLELTPDRLRVVDATLDDAFLDLTSERDGEADYMATPTTAMVCSNSASSPANRDPSSGSSASRWC